jgi:hypothetical protein
MPLVSISNEKVEGAIVNGGTPKELLLDVVILIQ